MPDPTVKKRIRVGLDEFNMPFGENHQNAKLTNEAVEHIRQLHDSGLVGYRRLAKQFGVTRSTIQGICNYRRRAVTAERYITIVVDEKELETKEVRQIIREYVKNKKGYA